MPERGQAPRTASGGGGEQETSKRTLYCGRLAADYRFVPFAVDDFGHIGDAGWTFLESLAAHAAETRTHDYRRGRRTADRRAHWLRIWQQRIAWAIHTGIDRSLQRRLALSRQLDRRDGGLVGVAHTVVSSHCGGLQTCCIYIYIYI